MTIFGVSNAINATWCRLGRNKRLNYGKEITVARNTNIPLAAFDILLQLHRVVLMHYASPPAVMGGDSMEGTRMFWAVTSWTLYPWPLTENSRTWGKKQYFQKSAKTEGGSTFYESSQLHNQTVARILFDICLLKVTAHKWSCFTFSLTGFKWLWCLDSFILQ